MMAMLKNSNKIFLLVIIIITISSKSIHGNQAYFDLSDNEIEIQTNFNGKEVIIFGLTDPKFETVLVIKGPSKNTKVQKKERLFGLWINTKRIIYKNLPSIFFIASSSPINEILNEETIIKKALYFEHMLINLITQRNFNYNESNKADLWNKKLIKIKKEKNFYKEYKIKIVDNKLFQTRVFFPANTIPGTYDINIYQVHNKIIVNEKNKKILVKKTGIGNKIFNLAHNQPATYGIICIFFAIFAGIIAATAFRRL